jgi:nucleoside-triphosphatase THEP1
MSIFILSNPIKSGKTTRLMEWTASKTNCEGILMPDVNGHRKMFDVGEKEYFDAECSLPNDSNEPLVKVGKYHFYQSAFDKANSIILDAANSFASWIIVDEVGSLELSEMGFYQSVSKLIALKNANKLNAKVLLVVRSSLLKDVVNFFEIESYETYL